MQICICKSYCQITTNSFLRKNYFEKKTRKTYCSNIASVGARPFVKYVNSFQEIYYEISVCSMFEHQTDNKDVRIYIDSQVLLESIIHTCFLQNSFQIVCLFFIFLHESRAKYCWFFNTSIF